MALQIIRDAPSRDSYTSLVEHQAQTPGTFFGGKPVLYYQAQGAKLSIDKQHLASDSSFASLAPAETEATSEPVVNGNSDHADQQQVELQGLDVWVTSEYGMDNHVPINRHYPSSDDEGAEQEPMPGAGGWITSENMHEFFDEEGNLRAPNGVTVLGGEEDTPAEGSLGGGAGTIRTADEKSAGSYCPREAALTRVRWNGSSRRYPSRADALRWISLGDVYEMDCPRTSILSLTKSAKDYTTG
ncbi:hypothetical protein M8818_005250 [Zalaria obscura]|uniref:Uncharacterized protein n=1 Tax=Zalaria obscura TaxID=2024903 RepID=A0ACC3S9J5_9PEZI